MNLPDNRIIQMYHFLKLLFRDEFSHGYIRQEADLKIAIDNLNNELEECENMKLHYQTFRN
jgi:hypothetical protein